MNTQLILAIVLSIASAFIIFKVKEKTGKLSLASLSALALGLGIGSIFKENSSFLGTVGTGYMSLVKMIVMPLVILAITTSSARLKDLRTLKNIGIKTVGLLLGTTGIAALLGIVVANLFNLGAGLTFNGAMDFTAKEIPAFSQVLLDMLPANPAGAIVDGKIIPVVIFSVFIAIALVILDNREPEKVKYFKGFLLGASEIVQEITRWILKLMPYGVFALIATAASQNGINTLGSLSIVIIAVYLTCLLQMLLVHTPLLAFVAKVNPLKFFKAIFPAQVVAFTSQSSYGTLPVTIESLVDGSEVSEEVAGFVAPIGATVGMNACGGLYPAIVAVFVANMFNIDLSLYHYGLIVLTTMISSLGIAGVPGAATMSTTVILSTLGLPVEGMAMIIAVDSVIDMMRTATNVTGAAVVAKVVDATEKRRK